MRTSILAGLHGGQGPCLVCGTCSTLTIALAKDLDALMSMESLDLSRGQMGLVQWSRGQMGAMQGWHLLCELQDEAFLALASMLQG